jgi:hypothetical protein
VDVGKAGVLFIETRISSAQAERFELATGSAAGPDAPLARDRVFSGPQLLGDLFPLPEHIGHLGDLRAVPGVVVQQLALDIGAQQGSGMLAVNVDQHLSQLTQHLKRYR